MLGYCYAFDYDDEGRVVSGTRIAEVDKKLTEAETHLLKRLLNNIAVYATAEKWEALQLKDLAQEKVQTLLSQHTLTPDLPLVIDAIFETTPNSDQGLRNVAIDFCKQYDEAIAGNDVLQRMIIDHGELALGMVQKMMQERAEIRRQSRIIYTKTLSKLGISDPWSNFTAACKQCGAPACYL